jgi:hypothetical protein
MEIGDELPHPEERKRVTPVTARQKHWQHHLREQLVGEAGSGRGTEHREVRPHPQLPLRLARERRGESADGEARFLRSFSFRYSSSRASSMRQRYIGHRDEKHHKKPRADDDVFIWLAEHGANRRVRTYARHGLHLRRVAAK